MLAIQMSHVTKVTITQSSLIIGVSHYNWDEFSSTFENTINNQLNITLGNTPAFVLFGRDTCPNIERKELSIIYNVDSVEYSVNYRKKKSVVYSGIYKK